MGAERWRWCNKVMRSNSTFARVSGGKLCQANGRSTAAVRDPSGRAMLKLRLGDWPHGGSIRKIQCHQHGKVRQK
jgi:hypothetical protein